MAGSPDRTELQRRLLAQKDMNRWCVCVFREPFLNDRKDLNSVPSAVYLSLGYYVKLAEKKPRLITGRGCETKITLLNMGYSPEEAAKFFANP